MFSFRPESGIRGPVRRQDLRIRNQNIRIEIRQLDDTLKKAFEVGWRKDAEQGTYYTAVIIHHVKLYCCVPLGTVRYSSDRRCKKRTLPLDEPAEPWERNTPITALWQLKIHVFRILHPPKQLLQYWSVGCSWSHRSASLRLSTNCWQLKKT